MVETDQCPLFEVETCLLLGGSKCISSMVKKSIGGKWAVRCTDVVRFLEGPLLEVLLYDMQLMLLQAQCNFCSRVN